MFRNFDYQNQGFISKKNIDEAFKRKDQRIDDNDVEQIFEDLDVDQDGRIDLQDFKSFFTQKDEKE
jgi:Ca2+-binding EF-hand superfamily protein